MSMCKITLSIPSATADALQEAATRERACDLADFILLAAWRHASLVLSTSPAADDYAPDGARTIAGRRGF